MTLASLVTRAQLVLGVAVMGSSLAIAAACSSTTTGGTTDGGPGTSGGTSGGGVIGSTKSCSAGSTTATCTQAETDSYNSCLTGMCDAEYQAELGAGYKTGSFSGACGTYFTCRDTCACNDTACFTKCGQPDAACTTSLQSADTCSRSKCQAPACVSATDGGTTHSCADLQACCAKIADATKKSMCTQTYDAVKTSDPSCNALYANYAASCP